MAPVPIACFVFVDLASLKVVATTLSWQITSFPVVVLEASGGTATFSIRGTTIPALGACVLHCAWIQPSATALNTVRFVLGTPSTLGIIRIETRASVEELRTFRKIVCEAKNAKKAMVYVPTELRRWAVYPTTAAPCRASLRRKVACVVFYARQRIPGAARGTFARAFQTHCLTTTAIRDIDIARRIQSDTTLRVFLVDVERATLFTVGRRFMAPFATFVVASLKVVTTTITR